MEIKYTETELKYNTGAPVMSVPIILSIFTDSKRDHAVPTLQPISALNSGWRQKKDQLEEAGSLWQYDFCFSDTFN